MTDIKTKLAECMTQLSYPESANLKQRGIADKIEEACNQIIKANFTDVTDARSRRSIEDVNIGKVYVDHKTSDAALDFKMPNLISIDRLMKLDRPLLYNFVIYDSNTQQIKHCFVLDVYELNWNFLKIQNLGVGQLQITNMTKFLEAPKSNMTKEEWLTRLQAEAIMFYSALEDKCRKRKDKWNKWKILS